MNPAAHPTRSAAIDCLRGLAIIAVVLHHFHIHVPAAASLFSRWPRGLQSVVFSSGYYGVMVFLVISGYLITSLSIQRWGRIGAIRPLPFYGLRFARIAPLLILLIVILIPMHLAGIPGFVIPADKASLTSVIGAALTFRINTLEADGYFLPACWGVLWSLSIEEVFYISLPVLSLVARRTSLIVLGLAILLILGPIARTRWPDYDDHTYLECLDGISIGCLTALIATHWRASRALAFMLLAVGLLAVGLIEFCRDTTFQWGLTANGLYISILELGTAALILAARSPPAPSRVLMTAAPFMAVGQCSYEIYMSHSFLTVGLGRLFRNLQLSPAYVPLWIAGGTLLSIALGYGIFRYFSEPLNRALRGAFGLRGMKTAAGPLIESSSAL